MISDATIKRVKFPPELIPDSWVGNVPLLADVAPAILDLKRFSPYLVALAGIGLLPINNVILKARYDDLNLYENTVAMPQTTLAGPGLPGAWHLLAKQYLFFNFYGGVAAPNYTTFYAVWVQQPTIAHKLVHAISLSSEEKEIAKKLGIADTVDKGLLPLPISQQIEREYYVLGEETKSRSLTLALPATDYTIENVYARANEFLVLTRIAAAPSTVAQNVRVLVDRDEDPNLVTLPTPPLSLILGGEINCFIPALHEIRLHADCAIALGAASLFRYTIKRVRLSNILRVRFGEAGKGEVPGDTYEKVMAGIL